MDYSDLVFRIAAAAGIEPDTDDKWSGYLPNIIEAAEARCYRDASLLCVNVTMTTATAPGSSILLAPADWLIGQRLTVKVGGMFQPVDRRDPSYLLEFDDGLLGVPRFWAEPMAGQIMLQPVPDQAYQIRLDYEGKQVPISATNKTTWLATNLPDLFFAACMSGVAAYQKNFGAQADNPQAALSWEAMYAGALKSALPQEGRRKGDGAFDSSASPPSASNAPKGA